MGHMLTIPGLGIREKKKKKNDWREFKASLGIITAFSWPVLHCKTMSQKRKKQSNTNKQTKNQNRTE